MSKSLFSRVTTKLIILVSITVAFGLEQLFFNASSVINRGQGIGEAVSNSLYAAVQNGFLSVPTILFNIRTGFYGMNMASIFFDLLHFGLMFSFVYIFVRLLADFVTVAGRPSLALNLWLIIGSLVIMIAGGYAAQGLFDWSYVFTAGKARVNDFVTNTTMNVSNSSSGFTGITLP